MMLTLFFLTTTAFLVPALSAEPPSPWNCHTVHRPNLYVGTKTCSPVPISTGLMWYAKGDLSKIRHTAEMNDNLKRWGWSAHNGQDFGRHALLDPKAQIHLTTEYMADQDSASNSWTMRISGDLTKTGQKNNNKQDRNDVSLVFYVTNADPSGHMELESTSAAQGPSSTITGTTKKEGRFSFEIVRTTSEDLNSKRRVVTHHSKKNRQTNRPGFASVSSSQVHSAQLRRNSERLWQTKDLLLPLWQNSQRKAYNLVQEEHEEHEEHAENEDEENSTTAPDPFVLPLLMNTTEKKANLIALQYTLAAPFELIVRYQEHNDASEESKRNEGKTTVAATTIAATNQMVDIATHRFNTRFEHIFGLHSKGYDGKQIAFAQAAFSNLIGSTTYFYGSSSVKPTQPNQPPGTTAAGPLITGVPSRSFFPRGFLWDEGFHQLLVSAWNPSLSRTVVGHWLNRMDENGWIPREQILGPEAVSKVPEKFRLQSPDIANPPAMLLTIENMLYPLEHPKEIEVTSDGSSGEKSSSGTNTLESILEERERTLQFLKEIYPKFALHYKWLKKTQRGTKKGTFRWRGQTSTHCLASGLDDYPRAKYFTKEEKHVDLLAWMIYAAKILKRVTVQLEKWNTEQDDEDSDDAANLLRWKQNKYKKDIALFTRSLKDHWNEKDGIWYDIGVDGVDHYDPGTGRILRFEAPKQVEHYGYVGLFPFLLQLVAVNDDQTLIKLMTNLYEPHLLWSPFGLRSLSKVDEYFGEGENYWRGKVWLNINYLALRSLKHYSIHATSKEVQVLASDIHLKLKTNLVDNLYKQYRRSGFVWENYSPKNGKGKGCFPFSGWSSLIVSIMAEKYR